MNVLLAKILNEPLLPISNSTVDLTPFLIMFVLLAAGSIVMRLRFATASGTLGLKTGRAYWISRGTCILAWVTLWTAVGFEVFKTSQTRQYIPMAVLVPLYGGLFAIITLAYLVPLLQGTDSRQPLRCALQSASFCAFVVGLHPCACMVRDFIQGLGFINVNNIKAFHYMSLVVSVFAFGLVWGRVFCGWVCPIGFLQEMFTAVPRAIGRLLRRTGVLPPEGMAPDTLKYIRVGAAAFSLLVLVLYVVFGPERYRGVQGIMVFWLMALVILTLFAVADPAWEKKLRNIRFVAIVVFIAVVTMGIYMYAAFCSLFTNTVTIITMILLGGVLLTTLILSQAWCRFLCPEGAVLSLLTRVSGWKINLDKGKCSGCNICQEVCPVEAIENGEVDEGSCLYCCTCVDHCPTDALDMSARPKKTLMPLPVFNPGAAI